MKAIKKWILVALAVCLLLPAGSICFATGDDGFVETGQESPVVTAQTAESAPEESTEERGETVQQTVSESKPVGNEEPAPEAEVLAHDVRVINLDTRTQRRTALKAAAASQGEPVDITTSRARDSNSRFILYVDTFQYNGHIVGEVGANRYIFYAGGKEAYCIEPGVALHGGDVLYTGAADAWDAMSPQMQEAVKIAMRCGRAANSGQLSGSTGSKYTATQMIIWEFITGRRSLEAPYTCTDRSVINTVCKNGANAEVLTVYEEIVGYLEKYDLKPSFMGWSAVDIPSVSLSNQGSGWSVTLTDENRVLDCYDFECSDSRVNIEKTGNTLTLSAPSQPAAGTVVTANRNFAVSTSSFSLVYGADNLQEVLVGVLADDHRTAYLKLAEPTGSLRITKTADDNAVSGIGFRVVGPGFDHTVQTDEHGQVLIDALTPGTYMVTEDVPNGYICQTPLQTATVLSGRTAELSFYNAKVYAGRITVHKEDAQGNPLSGAIYRLELKNDDNAWITVSEQTTGEDGTIYFGDLTANGSILYRLTEIRAPQESSLLSEPVFVGTIPTNAENPATDLEFTVVNGLNLRLPLTGGCGFLFPVCLGAWPVLAFSVQRKQKERAKE